ncbi:MAG TPA: hypothetical protein VEX86_03020, partial [Longimicrobium sp.]|nr:hypothetical protein [Longimicrobium sp.]
MPLEPTTTIRQPGKADVPKLAEFFGFVYGPGSVFSDARFVDYYFFSDTRPDGSSGSWLVESDAGEIVGFYGGLVNRLCVRGEVVTVTWGINAVNHPEWRKLGMTGAVLQKNIDMRTWHAIVGFVERAARYYHENGYQFFDFRKFKRYAYVLSAEETLEAVRYIGQDEAAAEAIFSSATIPAPTEDRRDVIRLDGAALDRYELRIQPPVEISTFRDRAQVEKRFLDHPYIAYTLHGVLRDERITAYVACREET